MRVHWRQAVTSIAAGWFILSSSICVSAATNGNNQVRGIVKAEAEATISTELIATVARVPFKPGESFTQGHTIIAFDCRRYLADLAAARAETKSAKHTLAMNQGLRRHKAIGAHDLAISAAKVDQAKARMQALKVRVEQCTIKAPFSGQIVERLINEHEMPQSNTPLLRIVKEGSLELGLIVPSHWLVWLKPQLTFQFLVEETGTTHRARILRIGAIVDPISRTANIEAKLIQPSPRVRPGMSGTATFAVPNR